MFVSFVNNFSVINFIYFKQLVVLYFSLMGQCCKNFFLIYEWPKQARMFEPSKHFPPSLMFVGKAWSTIQVQASDQH